MVGTLWNLQENNKKNLICDQINCIYGGEENYKIEVVLCHYQCFFFPEECENKNMYEDWDICQELTDEECNSPFPEERDMFREFCPKKCGVCSKYSTYIRRALFKLRPSHLVVA